MLMEGKGSSRFYQEYLNEAVDDETRRFKDEYLQKRFVAKDLEMRTLNRYVMIDPAKSKNDGADWTGVIVIDWDSENNWFIQYAKRLKINSPDQIKLIFNLWQNFEPLIIGYEQKAYEDTIKPYIEIKSKETGVFPVVKELEDGGTRKYDRIIGALEGRFEAGKIFFRKNSKDDQYLLRGELYDFPAGKNDDLADALAYAQQLGNRPYSKDKLQPKSIAGELAEYRASQRVVNPLDFLNDAQHT